MKHRITGQSFEVWDDTAQSWFVLCSAFGVDEVLVDTLTGKHQVTAFVDSARSGRNTITFPRDNIRQKMVMKALYSIGLDTPDGDDDVAAIQGVLLEMEQEAPVKFFHNRLGYAQIDGQKVYLLDKPVGIPAHKKSASEHVSQGPLCPRGTLDEWIAMVQDEVLGHIKMELALAIGAVAPVAHILRESGCIALSPIISLVGRTSTGKTSAMVLGASQWGRPTEGNGIIDDLHSTENAFFESLARNVGFPAWIDELSAQPTWDFARMIYHLPKGRSKRRCNPDGSLKVSNYFTGAVVFSGETSLLERASVNPGLHARIAEFTFTKWTDDDRHADRLGEKCRRCYGHAAPLLTQWLLDHEDEVPVLYDEERSLIEQIGAACSGVEHRIMKIYATIMTAACILNKVLPINLNLEALRELLVDQLIESRPQRDRPGYVYEYIKEYISSHGSRFAWASEHSEGKIVRDDIWGQLEFYRSIPCVWIGEEKMATILRGAGIQSSKEITADLADRGWLVRFSARHYFRNHRINGVEMNAFCVLFPDEANIFERMDTVPASTVKMDLLKLLRGDRKGLHLPSTQQQTEAALTKAADGDDPLMCFAFIHPYSQGQAIAINKPFRAKLQAKDRIYLQAVPAEKLVLLSATPFPSGVQVVLHGHSDLYVCRNRRLTNSMLSTFGMELPLGEALVFTEITVESNKPVPRAVVSVDLLNTEAAFRGRLEGWNLPPLPIDGSGSKISELLDDASDDDKNAEEET